MNNATGTRWLAAGLGALVMYVIGDTNVAWDYGIYNHAPEVIALVIGIGIAGTFRRIG